MRRFSINMENTNERNKTDEKPIRDKRGLFLPGNPGSPGRPRGTSLKEYWRQKLADMTEEERTAFSQDLNNELIWKMAEGNPATETNLGNKDGKPFIVNIVKEIAEQNDIDTSTSTDSTGQTPIQGSELREEIREDYSGS